MSKHITICTTEAADRLAIRDLVEAYAHCADRRDAKGQMSLFTPPPRRIQHRPADAHFVVHERQGYDALTGTALERGTCFTLRRLEQVRCHHPLRRTEHSLRGDEHPRNRGNLLRGASRHARRREATLNGCVAPLSRYLRKDGRHMAICGAPAARRLDG